MTTISNLLDGYQRFHKRHFIKDGSLYEILSTQGQSPKTLIIACSDSRVDPSILFDVNPGDLFVVRNVANLVPPYQPAFDSFHGTSAALEFAVCHLGVENIVILGHSQCGGINALMESDLTKQESAKQFSFIQSWVQISLKARNHVELHHANLSKAEKNQCCEKHSIVVSLENLMTFPWIREKVLAGSLSLHGWYFSVDTGKLENYSIETKDFEQI
ncbi:MAG: carbonic anhydrase [Alphaproteobacteria bacterium]|jgi:carbonic anhydrase|nr:carbonic anhydrase [Alphaproteobacteria bacterium]MBP9877818.1 carbonic anhydrase [Alphaproteobacteria bacterium]